MNLFDFIRNKFFVNGQIARLKGDEHMRFYYIIPKVFRLNRLPVVPEIQKSSNKT